MTDDRADESAILEILHAQRIAFWTKDFEGYQRCFAHEPYLTRWGWWRRGGIFIRRGWDEIAERFKRELTTFPETMPDNAYETSIDNLHLRIVGDIAYATYDQSFTFPDANRALMVAHELRILQRFDEGWKIVFVGLLNNFDARLADTTLVLDQDATVVRASAAALSALANDDDLVIRNGKLKARDRRANEALLQAIRRAATVDSSLFSTHVALPIVLDAGAGSPTRVWWVVADEGQISFSFGNRSVSEDRLEMTAHIFDLSPAQKKLAGLLAEGLALPEVAERMGITHNTARTHLQRVYEKTGVSTQTALVRVLLSTTSPL
jgi:DNA-binding CsgD family transcriptional regulator